MGRKTKAEKDAIAWYNQNIHITRTTDELASRNLPYWSRIPRNIRYRIIHTFYGVDALIQNYNRIRKD